jgi:hypothetical protein
VPDTVEPTPRGPRTTGSTASVEADPATPLSAKFGWRVLSDEQGARASLIHNPAPLSSWLGIPVLIGEWSRQA